MIVVLLSGLAFADSEKAIRDAVIYHAYFGNAKGMTELLEKGADPNTRDEHGWPVLAVTADRSDKEAFPLSKALIEAGADVNLAHQRNYPLLNAIKHHNAALVALLVTYDAHLGIHSPEGKSVYGIAKKLGNEDIIYYLEKQMHELRQTQTFLSSREHLQQITSMYRFDQCAFHYWGYYLRSKQDKNMDEEAIKQRMHMLANRASHNGKRAAQYFPSVFQQNFRSIADTERDRIVTTLNEMISNRNRRIQGIGKIKDSLKRCRIENTPAYFHATALQ